jgi:hypothetical protein
MPQAGIRTFRNLSQPACRRLRTEDSPRQMDRENQSTGFNRVDLIESIRRGRSAGGIRDRRPLCRPREILLRGPGIPAKLFASYFAERGQFVVSAKQRRLRLVSSQDQVKGSGVNRQPIADSLLRNLLLHEDVE